MKPNASLSLKFIVVYFISFSSLCWAQQRRCGSDELMAKILRSPESSKMHNARQAQFKSNLEKRTTKTTQFGEIAPIRIPVAVHFPNGLESDRSCLEALAQNQINILNADYTATNSDFNLWTAASSFYPGINNGNTNVQFKIATLNHPANTDTDLVEGEPAVTIGYDFGGQGGTFSIEGPFVSDIKWAGYLNIVIGDFIDNSLLGFSPIGGRVQSGDAVVMRHDVFGSGTGCVDSNTVPTSPYHLGRTVTHEIGHFLNLKHPFAGKSCTSDDGISDTPNIKVDHTNCPSPGSFEACDPNEKALTMNFMDYANDSCMYMFTQGQITVAEAYLATIESDFKSGVLSISSLEFDTVSVFPNPNKGSFNVKFQTKDTTDFEVRVFDLRGRKIYKKAFENCNYFNQTIHLENTQAGVYLMTVSSNGGQQMTKRVLIK